MHLLQAIVVGVLGSFSLSAWACSDLPNICEMNAQHHQQMQDYGREAAETPTLARVTDIKYTK